MKRKISQIIMSSKRLNIQLGIIIELKYKRKNNISRFLISLTQKDDLALKSHRSESQYNQINVINVEL